MAPPLHASLLRFWRLQSGGRAVVGTGFLSRGADGKIYALTCAHVANVVFGRPTDAMTPLNSGTTTADLFGGGEVTLDLVAWFAPPPVGQARARAAADIAVFVPRGSPALPFIPFLRAEPPGRVVPPNARVEFHSFGFMGTEDGTPSRGALTSVDAGGWFVAEGDVGFRRFIEEGLSGAPVYANGVVLGMITQRLEREVKQGLVIPAFALAQAWPPLAQPYPGLPAFDAPTAHLYFGRGRPSMAGGAPTGRLAQLLKRLETQRLVALMGASGSGKSSLAKAGVATFYEQLGWSTIVFRPGLQPLRGFAEAIVDSTEGLAPGPQRIDAVDRWVTRLDTGHLTTALDAARATGSAGILIVIDQFEELFTATSAREAECVRQRDVILPQIMAAMDRPDVHCLLTARLDLIERIVISDATAARMLSDPYPIVVLTAMSAGEVREAVEGPARVFGVEVEPGFAADLAAETTRGEGRLPLLQAALRRAWAGIVRTPDGWLIQGPDRDGTEDVVTILDDALGERADSAVASLKRGTVGRPGIPEDDLQRVLLSLVRLVAGVPARRILSRAETSPTDWMILEALAVERLVMLGGAEGTAELVHESLMTEWKLLSTWIGDASLFLVWLDRFDREFATWRDRGGKPDDLLRRYDAATALDWLTIPGPGRAPPSAGQRDYIVASRAFHDAESERQRRQLRRTRQWLVAAIFAGVGILMALFAAVRSTREATAAKEAALLQESRALVTLAEQEYSRGDYSTAMLLALEALPDPASGYARPISVDAAIALRQAWMQNRETALAGHTSRVTAASFSADGHHVITASEDHTARVWDLSGPRPVATVLEGHTDTVTVASFSNDGRYVVTASEDHTARVWDLLGSRLTAVVLDGHTDAVTAAAFSPDGRRVVTASEDHTALVWDLSRPNASPLLLKGHMAGLTAASFSADGTQILTASKDATARVWDLSGPNPAATVLAGHAFEVTDASFSADGRSVVTASFDGTARVWDLSERSRAPTVLKGHTDGLTAASFSADGRQVVTASNDLTARVWDLSRPGDPTVLEGHTALLTAASFSADGRHVLTASFDSTARVWDLTEPHPAARVLVGHSGRVYAAAFGAGDHRVVTASLDGTARVWDLSPDAGGQTVLKIPTERMVAASFIPDGCRIVTVAEDNNARVWEVCRPVQTFKELRGHEGRVNAASFSADGRWLVTASDDRLARVWDLAEANPIPILLVGHTGRVNAASFSADGHRVVTASDDRSARVWDLSRPKAAPVVLAGHGLPLNAASFSADGRQVVTASADFTARVWNLSGPEPTSTALVGHTDQVMAASFRQDGRRVVTASYDNTARLWDLSPPRPVSTVLDKHVSWVTAASFSADGLRVVTASTDRTALIWDLSGPRPAATILSGHTGALMAAAFSADGRRVISISHDGTARVWETYPDIADLSALVVAHLSRCLSVAQREHFGLAVEDTKRPRSVIPPPSADGICPR